MRGSSGVQGKTGKGGVAEENGKSRGAKRKKERMMQGEGAEGEKARVRRGSGKAEGKKKEKELQRQIRIGTVIFPGRKKGCMGITKATRGLVLINQILIIVVTLPSDSRESKADTSRTSAVMPHTLKPEKRSILVFTCNPESECCLQKKRPLLRKCAFCDTPPSLSLSFHLSLSLWSAKRPIVLEQNIICVVSK